ncbi:MAG: c-type cytochrome [Planctomycetes bacterium]|nr:c-type cytochrome [Planctomycetota bacterium]
MIIAVRSGMVLAAMWGLAFGDGPFEAPSSKPLTPREEQMTFRLPKGFVIELVAAEPDVIDPVAMAFDEKGRLFVAEMSGYPNGGVGTGKISSGRIRMLEDRDGDGTFETSTGYADGLRFPTSVMPYKSGLLVANAPDLVYLEDTTGQGKADKSRVLYTGFDIENIQQLLSGLQWGLDNWIHACAGGKGGTITCPENPQMKALTLRGRGIRFKPNEPGRVEATSAGGQYGLTQDDWGHWFTATNSQHLRQIVLPDHYLARNPNLPVAAVTIDIPDHGAACKVHRISPFESWRVERTKRRKDGPDSKRFPTTELVPGGFITSACSPLVYLADLFPKEYRGNVLVCDPANNLIHRDILEPTGGAAFIAKRGEQGCEFLASTDTWFRPVWLTLGPDGAMYIADFYHEVIETPLSLPEDMKKVLPLKSQGRGRIWRVRPEGPYKAPRFDWTKSTSDELVRNLDHPNAWWRLTAQRLLLERQDPTVVAALNKLASTAKTPQGRVHGLRTLEGLGRLEARSLFDALKDPDALVRAHALQLTEPFLKRNAELRGAVVRLADDDDAPVRFQLAFTLGAMPEDAAPALARLALRDGDDPWAQTAILTSTGPHVVSLLEGIVKDRDALENRGASGLSLLTRLAALVGAQNKAGDLDRAFDLVTGQADSNHAWQAAVLEGLCQGLNTHAVRVLDLAKERLAPERRRRIEALFSGALTQSKNETSSVASRVRSIRLLAYAPFEFAEDLRSLLQPQHPQELQLAAIRAIAVHPEPKVAGLLLESWANYSPAVRREALEALLGRKERAMALLDAVESKRVLAGQLEPARLEQLRKHPDAKLRERAAKLLAGIGSPERAKVVEEYRSALDLKAEVARGRAVFKKNCATCHRLENVGIEVGPDLASALANKTPEQLLIDILDPSREVDPRYIDYLVVTTDGRILTGMIASETAAAVTLRRAEKVEETILRSQIESIAATPRSLMPEGMERQLSRQEMADLIGFLMTAGKK